MKKRSDGNVVVVPDLVFGADTNALLNHAPNITGEPSLVAMLELRNIHPCLGHWHAVTDLGDVTFGPAIGDERRSVALYAGESDHAAIQHIVDVLKAAGVLPQFDYDEDWKIHLFNQEYERLDDEQQIMVLTKSGIFVGVGNDDEISFVAIVISGGDGT